MSKSASVSILVEWQFWLMAKAVKWLFWHKIVSVKKIVVDRKHGYGHLKNIVVKRSDQKDYKLMESDFPRLNMNDLEDMYLLKVQGKIHHLDGVDEFDLINALLLYIRRIVIKKRVEDAQLGVESYENSST
ncbi:hypothetical protein Tco_1293569 [Tanacetum coccineum]